MKKVNNTNILSLHNSVGIPLLLFYLLSFSVFHGGLIDNLKLFKDQVSIVTDIAFFNLVHIAFTFLGLVFIKEMRTWYRIAAQTNFKIKLAIPVTFLATGIIYIFFFEKSISWEVSRFALRAYGLHHSVMQTYGIFLLSGALHQKFESKKYFLGISISYIFALAAFFFVDKNYQNFILYPAFLLCVFSVFQAIRRSLSMRNETLFLSRLIIFPIGIFSPIMAMAISAFHGLEYVLFFKQLSGKSQSKSEIYRFSLTSLFIFAAVGLYGIMCFLNLRNDTFGFVDPKYYREFAAPAGWLLFWWFMDSLNILHYFYDSVMFRAKSPESKKYILSLLKGNH